MMLLRTAINIRILEVEVCLFRTRCKRIIPTQKKGGIINKAYQFKILFSDKGSQLDEFIRRSKIIGLEHGLYASCLPVRDAECWLSHFHSQCQLNISKAYIRMSYNAEQSLRRMALQGISSKPISEWGEIRAVFDIPQRS